MGQMCWRSSEDKRTPGAPVDPALCVLFDLLLEHSVNCISPWQLTESAQQSSLNHSPLLAAFLTITDNCTSIIWLPCYRHIFVIHVMIFGRLILAQTEKLLCAVCFRTVVVYFAFATSCFLWPFFSASICIPAPPETRTM